MPAQSRMGSGVAGDFGGDAQVIRMMAPNI